MLADILPEEFNPKDEKSVAEVKYDGHRCLVRIKEDGWVEAWSRDLINCIKKLDISLIKELKEWEPGIYDGELYLGIGYSSSDVSRLENKNKLKYIAFDRLSVNDFSIMNYTWEQRRHILEEGVKLSFRTNISDYYNLYDRTELDNLSENLMNNKEEGVIVKKVNSHYFPGKRSDAFMKIKSIKVDEFFIINYIPPKKETEFGRIVVSDNNGLFSSVKVPNLILRQRFLKEGTEYIGRKCLIEYQDKTVNGKLRHPRFDRFSNE